MYSTSIRRKLLKKASDAVFRASVTSALLLFMAGNGQAQQASQLSIKVGEADLYPSVRTDYLSLSNAFRRSENEVEATGVRVAPSAILIANKRGLEVKTGYEGAYASFSEDELNYADHYLFGSLDAILGTRKRLSGSAYVRLRHQELGTYLTEGIATFGSDQVEIADLGIKTAYTYGARTARFNLTGGLNLQSVTFQNRRDITQGRDYIDIAPYGRLSYRLSVDTRALFEVGIRSLSFDNSRVDRNEARMLTGLSFRGTGKSGGEAKIGVSALSFNEGDRADQSTLTADIGLYFLPSSFARFDLDIQREFNNEEATEAVQTIDDTASIQWQNQWSGFVSTTAFVELQNQNRDCPTSSTQSVVASFELSVKPRRWIELGAGVSNTSQSADSCVGTDSAALEYDVQKLSVFLNVSL